MIFRKQKSLFWIVLLISAILLSTATVYAQVEDLTVHFLKVQQEKVHLQMMDGVAGNPWQYRILADWMISYLIRFLRSLNVARPELTAFVAFRAFQCLLILLFAGLYYRKLGLHLLANLLGLSVLAWGMSNSLYNSDLSFNIFFDVAFYLLAAIFILDRRFIWIPPLMVLAAFNRETSLLIPGIVLAYVYFSKEEQVKRRRAIGYALGGLLIFAAIFFGLRSYYGEQPFLTADGYSPGFSLLSLNLRRAVTWEQLLVTFGIVPLLALLAYRSWSQPLKIFFWTIVPLWTLVHFFAALVAETRLFLVPQALVFIPAALMGVVRPSLPDQEVTAS